MKTRLDKALEKYAVPAEEVFAEFAPEDQEAIKREVRFIELTMELRKLRKKLGLTQKALAEKVDVPRTTITKLESGNHNPTLGTLMNIASALGKSLKITFI